MERVWASRLRWRLRGAWLAPALVVFVVADGVLLSELPLTGEGPDLVGGLLLAAFFNLVAVAAVVPLVGVLVRRRRPDLPTFVARDRAGVVLVVAIAIALLVGGLLHRGELERNRDAMREAVARGEAWIGANPRAPAEIRRHVRMADVVAILDGSVYRVCVTRPSDPRRAFCAVVDTTAAYPAGIRYGGTQPNLAFNAGR